MKRAIVVVMDGCGAGEAPDAAQFGDHDHPNTLGHVWEGTPDLKTPYLDNLGLFAAAGVTARPAGKFARYGRLRELSQGGKDSVTGHWEMAGIVTEVPFPTYPTGFPADLISAFETEIGTSVLGNRPASGTQILEELGPEHVRTGRPILYTSADSVFQVAAHESVVPIERLYAMCEIGRRLCSGVNSVQRVIARPFTGEASTGYVRTERRKDYPLAAPPNVLDALSTHLGQEAVGVGVVPELFGGRGFRPGPRTQNNAEHAVALRAALETGARFIWANFEDFDMRFGHRNDPAGFAGCLEQFDIILADLLPRLTQDDLLILTADHGNDPTSASTDHSREYVPAVLVGTGLMPANLGEVDGMTSIGATVAHHLGVPWSVGTSLI